MKEEARNGAGGAGADSQLTMASASSLIGGGIVSGPQQPASVNGEQNGGSSAAVVAAAMMALNNGKGAELASSTAGGSTCNLSESGRRSSSVHHVITGGGGPSRAHTADFDYLTQLMKDKRQLAAFPNVFTCVERLLDEEISRVRVSLFQCEFQKEPLQLPDPQGEVTTRQEKVFVPVKSYPEYNFVGRILGPRGLTAKQLEAETGCKIMVRGRGSMRDKKKEDANRGKPNWEHLNEDLHVLVQCEDTPNRIEVKLARAIEEVQKLLIPSPEGEDDLKRKQLMELAIINGTYRNSQGQPLGLQAVQQSPTNALNLAALAALGSGQKAAYYAAALDPRNAALFSAAAASQSPLAALTGGGATPTAGVLSTGGIPRQSPSLTGATFAMQPSTIGAATGPGGKNPSQGMAAAVAAAVQQQQQQHQQQNAAAAAALVAVQQQAVQAQQLAALQQLANPYATATSTACSMAGLDYQQLLLSSMQQQQHQQQQQQQLDAGALATAQAAAYQQHQLAAMLQAQAAAAGGFLGGDYAGLDAATGQQHRDHPYHHSAASSSTDGSATGNGRMKGREGTS